jgi:hypothetical protein
LYNASASEAKTSFGGDFFVFVHPSPAIEPITQHAQRSVSIGAQSVFIRGLASILIQVSLHDRELCFKRVVRLYPLETEVLLRHDCLVRMPANVIPYPNMPRR